jgi:RNA polymerase sigma-70 factor (ECF subfamily)
MTTVLSEPISDVELLERWAAGCRDAGGELFERHFDSLLRFFQNKVDHAVEDLVQQTMLACVEGRERFRRDASFRTYLFQTARHLLYAHYRSRPRSGDLDFELASVADLGTSPTSALARKEQHRYLFEALQRIPLQYQIVLELRLWEDLSGAEMATILDLPEPTLRSRLRLAAEKLKAQMQALGGCGELLHPSIVDFEGWAARIRTTLHAARVEP